ncbi:uncharacterized protein PGTG_05302 [Puccinia graminis f. sp. tritici CRL 75-36-700-3]|uniref:Uncharacterized protein n=1 Tax=Puccinia graminis f. sp. tritici (strain CRL 75-36-700-3 / race SCCL) TaxID=418459 RepID=E3K6Y8_PUCGT|nr:uncharacterized protein PGTG_05302 [Puccinia graminis f. sp. tritici CRL 75-36-700-3]EFP80077.1 hypothetical protein PGTG_05302 [Puccinia graminis f. sp. tritici CRL 75-36-700-3]
MYICGTGIEEDVIIDPACDLPGPANPSNQASNAYPAHQATKVEEDEVPSYPPPAYVHAVCFAPAGPYTTPAMAGPPRSIVDSAPRRVYSTPRHAGSALPGVLHASSCRFRFAGTSWGTWPATIPTSLGTRSCVRLPLLLRIGSTITTLTSLASLSFRRTDQFAKPHSMGHLLASSVRFTLGDSLPCPEIP